jgi:transcriptional regulator with XRE-family HTH domain
MTSDAAERKRPRYPNDLRYCIKQQGYTIQDVAARTGIPRRTLSDYLTGSRPIPRAYLKKLARVLRCSIHEIIPEPDLVVREKWTLAAPENIQKQGGMPSRLPDQSLTVGNTSDWLEIGMMALALAFEEAKRTADDWHPRFEQVKRSIFEMIEQNSERPQVSRRHALSLLARLPVALLGLTLEGSSVPLFAEELLPLCATSIPACWELYYDGHLAEVQKVLPVYCAKLAALAEQPLPQQRQAATLASQAYQLSSQILGGQEDFGAALAHCQQALTYARLADDANLQVASLIFKADIYFSKRYPLYSPQTYQAYREALPLLKHASPLLQGRLYASLAECHAYQEQEQEALRYMGLAQTIYPADPKADPAFAYTGHSHFSLYVYGEGRTYLRLGQLAKARQALERVEATLPKALGVRREILAIRQAEAAVAANDLEQSCCYLQTAVRSARQLGNNLHRSHALEIYQTMPEAWHHEKPIKELTELLHE